MHNFFKPLVLILSLLLVTSAATTFVNNNYNNNNNFYDLTKPQYAFAQDDKEEEDKEEEEEEKEEDKDSKEEDKEEEKEKEGEEEQKETTEQINETTIPTEQQQQQQAIQNELKQLIINSSLSPTGGGGGEETYIDPYAKPAEPVTIPTTTIPTTTVEEEPKKENMQLSCNCTTNDIKTFKPTTTTTAAPTIEQQQEEQQIQITPQDIISSKSTGEVIDEAYTGFYTVSNLFDNLINDYSFWSQAGKSSFTIQLDNILDNYQVCSAELSVHDPKNTPYSIDIGLGKTYTGIIDQMTETIQFDKCVKNIDEITMTFDPPNGDFISIGELKMFGKKLVTGGDDDGQQQPQPLPKPPQPAPYKNNATKINIKDSTAEIDITNSTVTFKFDPQSAKATGYNIITIPNTEVVN